MDKGIVIDAYVRVSFVGIELLTIDARVVVASVDTYLRFAEATNRLDLWEKGGRDLVDIVTEGGGAVVEKVASSVVERKVDSAFESVGNTLGAPAEKVTRKAAKKVADVAEDVVSTSLEAVEKRQRRRKK
jgi:gas vesicle structural protein